MGKVTRIDKSRKEFKCSKCGKVIAKGSAYYRGVINFHPDIIRCTDCGLKQYEVTTSDYIQRVGRIVEDWSEDYDATEFENIRDDLGELRDELQERLDNMPEALQDSDTGQTLQERIESLEASIIELDSIDADELKQEAIDENTDEPEDNDEPEVTIDNIKQYEDIYSEFDSKLSEAIDTALSEIVY